MQRNKHTVMQMGWTEKQNQKVNNLTHRKIYKPEDPPFFDVEVQYRSHYHSSQFVLEGHKHNVDDAQTMSTLCVFLFPALLTGVALFSW